MCDDSIAPPGQQGSELPDAKQRAVGDVIDVLEMLYSERLSESVRGAITGCVNVLRGEVLSPPAAAPAASEGIDALAAELCRQHEVSEMGGSWGKAAVKSLIEKHLPSLAASESARREAERERDRYSNQFGDCMDKLGNWQRISGCSHPAALEKKLSAAEQSAAAMREALTKIDARCCDASSRVPAIGLLSGPERALCDVHTIARAALASQPENRE